MNIQPTQWFIEQPDKTEHHMFACKKVIFMGNTAYQAVQILDTHGYGKMLVLDGRVQSSEDDEFIYHEALIHPAMMIHPDPRRVLIIGGGEGASLREVLFHSTVEKVTMVDLDKEIVELAKLHLEEWHEKSFDDPRVNLVFGDGRKFLEDTNETYDVIITDITDIIENGPSLALYTKEFYALTRKRLNPSGILVVQALELSMLDYEGHASILATLKAIFPIVRSYKTFIPSFWGEWGFLIASDSADPLKIDPEVLEARISRRLLSADEDKLEFYDAQTHFALFHLPKTLQQLLEKSGVILEDNKPIKISSEEFSL